MASFPTRNWPSWTAALRNLSVKPRLKLEILLCALPIILSHESSISSILKKIVGLRTVAGEVGSIINACPDPYKIGKVSTSAT